MFILQSCLCFLNKKKSCCGSNVNFSPIRTLVDTFSLRRFQENSALQTTFSGFKENYSLTSVEENDVLVHHYKNEEPYRDVYFWISRPQDIVRWSQDSQLRWLKNNEYLTTNRPLHTHNLILTVKDDFVVVLECQAHRDIGYRDCNGHEALDEVLSLLLFQILDKNDSNKQDILPSESKSCMNDPNFIHAASKLTLHL